MTLARSELLNEGRAPLAKGLGRGRLYRRLHWGFDRRSNRIGGVRGCNCLQSAHMRLQLRSEGCAFRSRHATSKFGDEVSKVGRDLVSRRVRLSEGCFEVVDKCHNMCSLNIDFYRESLEVFKPSDQRVVLLYGKPILMNMKVEITGDIEHQTRHKGSVTYRVRER